MCDFIHLIQRTFKKELLQKETLHKISVFGQPSVMSVNNNLPIFHNLMCLDSMAI